jgi:hypothetical protein
MPPVVKIVRPNISEEERLKRINQLAETMSQLMGCEVTLTIIDEKKDAN